MADRDLIALNALYRIVDMDPEGIRADDLGRAARIASEALNALKEPDAAAPKADERRSAEPICTVYKGGLGGPWCKVQAWHAAGMDSLPDGETKLYTHPDSAQPPTVEQSIALLVSALAEFKGWMRGYADGIIRDAIDRTDSAQARDAALEEAAKVCETMRDHQRGSDAAEAIRALKGDATQAVELRLPEIETAFRDATKDHRNCPWWVPHFARAIERAVLAKNGLGGKQ